MKKICELKPEDLNCNIFSCYDYDGLSLQELLCQFFTRINECIEVSNNALDFLEWLKEQGLEEEVVKVLKEWLDDGTLADIIDKGIFDNIKGRMDKLEKKFISIDQFGAVGDGVTDDYPAIMKALQYCWDNKIDTLYIPKGKFYVSKGIETKEVKLVGLSKPWAPDEFNDYARPGLQTRKYREILAELKGSIITSDRSDINIFKDGLYAENIMIYGDCRAARQNGIGQTDGGPGNQIRLTDVYVICCGQDGINAPYGLISPRLFGCNIRNNIRHAVYIGKEIGTYTGETNDIIFKYNNFNHNGDHGLNMHLSGRVFHIENNTFEKCYPSPSYSASQRQDIKYGCKVILTDIERTGTHNSLGTGDFVFKGNYTELTMGLLWIKNETDAYNYEICNNFFGLWGKGGLSTSIYIDINEDTKLKNVIINNNTAKPNDKQPPYTYLNVTDNVFINGWNRIFNLTTNQDINKDNSSINRTAYSFKSEVVDGGTIAFMNTIGTRNLTPVLPNPVTAQYPPSYDEDKNETTITLNTGSIKAFKLADTKDIIGSMVRIGDIKCGYVKSFKDGGPSNSDNLILFGKAPQKILESFDSLPSKSLVLLDAGSITMLNGLGEVCKLIVDHEGKTMCVKK